MPTYAVGDVQGCRAELDDLLEHIGFSPERGDRLWLVGDLVNRGADSLGVLERIVALGDAATVVLGNHDLHLLAVASGHKRPGRQDTLDPILSSTRRDELLEWLRHRPMLHHDPALEITMVHAGIAPQWSLAEARERARELEDALRGNDWTDLLATMYGNEPARWDDALDGAERLRHIVNVFTRMRMCRVDGALDLSDKGPWQPEDADRAAKLEPWFVQRWRNGHRDRIVFGHWAALDGSEASMRRLAREYGVHHVDHGCVWGGRLSALRLEDGAHFAVAAQAPPATTDGAR